jgi:hypothetical protein
LESGRIMMDVPVAALAENADVKGFFMGLPAEGPQVLSRLAVLPSTQAVDVGF